MSISEILPSDVQFCDSSFMDPNGKVFYWNDRLFRGIYPRRVSFYRDFLKSPAYLSLHESGRIVETSIADLALRDFGAVLEHKKIAQISYCFEWPPEMLKDAALATLDICDRLLLDGKTLQDTTPWNILFDRLNPVLIDFTSVSEINPQILWAPYQQFCNFFYHPLLLYSFGRRSLARRLLFNYSDGISSTEVRQSLSCANKFRAPGYWGRVALPELVSKLFDSDESENRLRNITTTTAVPQAIRRRFFAGLRQTISAIDVGPNQSAWSSYYSETDQEVLNTKKKVVAEVLSRVQPKSVIDIGCNSGEFSVLAAESGADVVAFDMGEGCVSHLHATAKKRDLSITPLVIDILNPSPKFGWCGRQFESASSRFQGDMVFLFAVLHHLVFSKGQDFRRAIAATKQFQKGHALIEFVGKDDKMAMRLRRRINFDDSWYTEENFVTALRDQYCSVEKVARLSSTRSLYLCRA